MFTICGIMHRFLLIASLLPFLTTAQGEADNWYFGQGAGLRFNPDGTVEPLSDGKMDTFEGCATISDGQGNLLFYTDGITVFNRDHEIMDNGQNLFGFSSSTQSAIIVPKPQDPNLFYVFTVDTRATGEEEETSYDGFNYSVIDISKNGGVGSVVEKNIQLLEASAEKISAVLKDCSDSSVWVITLSSENGMEEEFELEDGTKYLAIDDYNTFHAFKVDQNGVSNNSVKSTFEHDSILRVFDPRGYLKLSPNGEQLASASQQNNGIYLYDFEKETGRVFNERNIEFQIAKDDLFYAAPYGIEFSPNGKYLYSHVLTYEYEEDLDTVFINSALLQFNLDILPQPESEIILEKERPIFRGALQLGGNGKIYRTIATDYESGTNFLGVIHNPNSRGNDANYVHNAIQLEGIAMQGLPPFIQSFFDKEELALLDDGSKTNSLVVDIGQSFVLQGDIYENAKYVWKKDGIVLSEMTGNKLEIFNAQPDDGGRYTLKIEFPNEDSCPLTAEAYIQIKDTFKLGFPKFFTPNNDGINDNWHHLQSGDIKYNDLRISIYNRYGQLLQEIDNSSNGWDGTFRGRPMPSSDYWYKAMLGNKKRTTGYFTLKR